MAKKIVIDYRYADVAQKHWGNQYDILPSYKADNLAEPVCGHPDMTLIQVGDVYVAEKNAFKVYQKTLDPINVVCGKTSLKPNYPEDIAYNVLICGKFAFAREDCIDAVLKEKLIQYGYSIRNIRQGYAKCSAAVFKDCIITADMSISKSAIACGIHICNVENSDVALPGYDYGFIGGASGFVDGTLMFFGDITKHRDYEKIKAFMKLHQTPMEWIPGYPLTDVGGILCIE